MNDSESTGTDRTMICEVAPLRQGHAGSNRCIKLMVVDGSDAGRQIDVPEGLTLIGREQDNALVLDLPSVSRRHAEVQRKGDNCSITDLGAANGVYINGDKLSPGQVRQLQHGDSLALGKARLVFLDPESERRGDAKTSAAAKDDWIKRIYAIDPLADKDY